ncbi:MAG: AI-2E family transporter [Planctomycetes bacterium]|nr:AI-2E family transporter [Planctomycetota bacterium]
MAKKPTGARSKAATARDPEAPRDVARLHIWQIQAVRDVLLVAAVVGVFWVGYALRAVTVPLLVALLLAYLFEPLIARLCRHPKISRPVAVGGLLATLGLALVIVISLALPLVIGQTRQFVGDVKSGEMRRRIAPLQELIPDSYDEDFHRFLEILPGENGETGQRPAPATTTEPDATSPPAPAAAPLTTAEVESIVDARLARERQSLRDEQAVPRAEGDREGLGLPRGSVQAIFSALGSVVQVGLVTFLIPFYFFFFSVWYSDVVQFLRNLLPEKNKPRTLELLGKMDAVVAGFVRGRIVISVIMGAMLAVGWMICGVPYAISLGLVVGVFCAVPYLGMIGIPVAVALLFFDRYSPDNAAWWWVWVILWPTVVFAIVQLIEGYVLTPMIAGKATNLDPVTILVVVLAGGSVLGVYGMLLAIPLAACGKILITDMLLPYVRAWTRGERSDPLPIDQ